MNTVTHRQTEPTPGSAVAEVLSPEAGKRGIELAFLERVTKAAFSAAVAAVEAGASVARKEKFSTAYTRMRSPVFEKVSKALEHTVPEDAGFGRFRDGK